MSEPKPTPVAAPPAVPMTLPEAQPVPVTPVAVAPVVAVVPSPQPAFVPERPKAEPKQQLSVAVKPGSKIKARGNAAATKPSSPARAPEKEVLVAARPQSSPPLDQLMPLAPLVAAEIVPPGSGLPVARGRGRLIDEEPLQLGEPTSERRDKPEFQEIPRRDPVAPQRSRIGRGADDVVPAFDGIDGPSIGAPANKPGELSQDTDYVDVLPQNWVRQAVELEDDD